MGYTATILGNTVAPTKSWKPGSAGGQSLWVPRPCHWEMKLHGHQTPPCCLCLAPQAEPRSGFQIPAWGDLRAAPTPLLLMRPKGVNSMGLL